MMDTYPQGEPLSVTCRWCHRARTRVKDALVCVVCDMVRGQRR